MPPRPFRHTFSTFTGGQNTMRFDTLLASGDPARGEEGKRVYGQRLRVDVLSGLYGPGTSVATVTTGQTFLHYHRTAGWLVGNTGTSYNNWACRDANDVSYVTTNTGTPAKPKIYNSAGTAYDMGLVAPAASPALTAGGGDDVAIAYTYVQEDGGSPAAVLLESNPSSDSTTAAAGGTCTGVAPSDARITHLYYYATQAGDPTGIKYYIGKAALPAVALNTSGLTPDTAQPLNWGYGGHAEDDLATSDHSPSGLVTCFPAALHGGANQTDGNQGGTLFYGVGSTLGWTHTGLVQYFPAKNQYRLPAVIEALVSRNATTYAFTPVGIWEATGVTDDVIQVVKTRAAYGCPLGWGKSVVETPKGILYLSNEGVTLFDGLDSIPLSSDLIHPNAFRSQEYGWCAAYIDDYYILSNLNGWVYIFDFKDFPRKLALVEATNKDTNPLNITAFAEVPSITGGPEVGAYIASGTAVKPWRPDDQNLVTGATTLAVLWKTGALEFGAKNKRKRLTKYRFQGAGSVTMSVWADKGAEWAEGSTDPDYTTTLTLPMRDSRWFPSHLNGRYFVFRFEIAADSTANLEYGGEIEGVVAD